MNIPLKGIWVLVFITTTISCSDDDIAFTLKEKYQSSRTEFSNVRIFTKTGEIVNKLSIDQVVQRYKELNTEDFEFLAGDVETKVDEIMTLSFQNGIASLASSVNSNEFSYHVTNDFVRFVSLDTISYITADKDFISEHLILHRPLYKTTEIIPVSTGFSVKITTLPELYGNIQSEQLKFPLIRFFLLSNSGFSGSFNGDTSISTTTSINNELNESVFNGLSERDTLIVQQNWLIFE